MNITEILARAKNLARGLAQQWLHATVYRLVWNTPFAVMIVIAIVLFIWLSVTGP